MLHTKKCLLFRTYIKAPSPYKSKASMWPPKTKWGKLRGREGVGMELTSPLL
jgi:hypothetical protein